jgi:hypothetical protein
MNNVKANIARTQVDFKDWLLSRWGGNTKFMNEVGSSLDNMPVGKDLLFYHFEDHGVKPKYRDAMVKKYKNFNKNTRNIQKSFSLISMIV